MISNLENMAKIFKSNIKKILNLFDNDNKY